MLFCTLASATRRSLGPWTGADFRESSGGRGLESVIEALGAHGVRWAFAGPRPEELDGGLVTGPGFDSELIVRADQGVFYRVWLPHIEYDATLCPRTVVVSGWLFLRGSFR